MENTFHQQNRRELYPLLPANSLLLLFSGHAPRKTGDEDYPFFADRSFLYYTGIAQADSVLAVVKDASGASETLFMLPPDAYLERWNGRRLRGEEAEALSAIGVRLVDHIIVADRDFVSMAENGSIPQRFF